MKINKEEMKKIFIKNFMFGISTAVKQSEFRKALGNISLKELKEMETQGLIEINKYSNGVFISYKK